MNTPKSDGQKRDRILGELIKRMKKQFYYFPNIEVWTDVSQVVNWFYRQLKKTEYDTLQWANWGLEQILDYVTEKQMSIDYIPQYENKEIVPSMFDQL